MKLFGYEISVRNATKWGSYPPRDPALISLFGSLDTASGVAINEHNSLSVADWYKGVRVIAEAIAMLPWKVYQEQDRGKKEAKNHPLFRILNRAPNDNMTSFVFREVMAYHLLNWGNFYAYKERFPYTGEIVALWPLCPDAVIKDVKDRIVTFRVRSESGTEVTFGADEIFHVPGFGYDGYRGYCPVTLHREALGLSKATEKYGARFFGNGSRPGGFLAHPGQLKAESIKRIKESWESAHRGVDAAHRIAVLEEGMKFEKVSVDPNEAQFMETRKFQRGEIAGLLRVPPHMIGDLERATFTNIEHQSLEFYRDTLAPWLIRIEQEADRSLFNEREQKKYFNKFEVKGVLRGDTAAQTQHIKEMFYIGIYSPNDGREFLDLNLIEGGDTYYVPLNMIPADLARELLTQKTEPKQPNEPDNTEDDVKQTAARYLASYKRIFRDSIGRIINREAKSREKYASALIFPAISAICEAFTGKISASDEAFLNEYAASLALRSLEWTTEKAEEITDSEFKRAVDTLSQRSKAA